MKKPLLVIVGAGPGVSAGVARKFGKNGFTVLLLARKKESLDKQIAELSELGIEVYGIVADAAKSESLITAFDKIKSEHGNPDVLVYNAGSNAPIVPSILTEKDLLNDFQVNVVGALVSAQQVIPDMIQRKTGTILFTGGALALNPVAARASVSISKAGTRNLAFAFADELSPHGICVGTVTIGGVVQPGTFYDPDLIAEAYWDLHINRDKKEILFKES